MHTYISEPSELLVPQSHNFENSNSNLRIAPPFRRRSSATIGRHSS